MSVTVGSDTYGRVKSVQGIPVVTKFAMLQFLPIYPQRSYYILGDVTRESSGVPMFASETRVSFPAIELASLDSASVLMTYLRGLFGAMCVLGFIPTIVGGVSMLNGQQMDSFARYAFGIAVGMLLIGIAGGLLTYLFGKATAREKAIRIYCAELIRLPIDPALVSSENYQWILRVADSVVGELNQPLRAKLLRKLVQARIEIARGTQIDQLEAATDKLLAELDSQTAA